MKNIFVAVLFIIAQTSIAQVPSIEWQKCYGGIQDDFANSIIQTSDEGFITAGVTGSISGDVTGNHGTYDAWLVKSDSNGNIQWQKCYGGANDDRAESIQKTSDGGYVFAGISMSNDGDVTLNHGGRDYWIVKIDSIGSLQWQKSYGGSQEDWAQSIIQTSDGNFIVAGYTQSNDGDVTGFHGGIRDYWVLKLDSSGNLIWQKCFGGSADDRAYSVIETKTGNYLIAGGTFSNDSNVTGNHGSYDYWIIELDTSNQIVWQKCYGGSSGDIANCIQLTNDNGYIIAGESSSYDGEVTSNHGTNNDDFWIVKIDSIGGIQWQKCYGGSGIESVYESVLQTKDNGYVFTGPSGSTDGDVSVNYGNMDFWVVKIDSAGTLQWQKSLGGTWNDIPTSILQTNTGDYIITGYTTSVDGDIISNHSALSDEWVVKLGYDNGINNVSGENGIEVYSNPSSGIFHLTFQTPNKKTITMFDLNGRKILQTKTNEEKISINLSNQPKGIYFIQVVTDVVVYNQKLILQ